jgi:hypothetical protein
MFRHSEVKNIEFNDLIYVEVTAQNRDYLFIININEQEYLIKFEEEWQLPYSINSNKVKAYESLFIEK